MSKPDATTPAYRFAIWALDNIFSGLALASDYTSERLAAFCASVGVADMASAAQLLGYAAPAAKPSPFAPTLSRPATAADQRRAAAHAPFRDAWTRPLSARVAE